jgi:hypothetical protein
MSLEADLIEVRKVVKAFASLAQVESALDSVVQAEARLVVAKKALAAVKDEHGAVGVELAETKAAVAAAKKQAQDIVAEAKIRATAALTKADADAKLLAPAAKAKADAIVDAAIKDQIAAQAAVDLAKAEKARLDADVTAANTKLTEIRAAIAAVVGK